MTKFALAFLLFAFVHQILAVPLPNETEEQKEFRVPIKFAKFTNAANSSLIPVPDVFSMYMVSSITVGTARKGEKAQEMRKVIFTLASGDFWVQDYTARQAKQCPYNLPVDTFYPENSTSFHPTGLTFETNSYKGKVNGTVGVDNVQIADGLVAENARIGQATNYHCYFIEYMNSGVLGLGLPALGNPNISHASPVLKAVSKLPNPLFTININPDTEEGSITFGSLNPAECANQWKFAPLSPSTNGFWQVQTSSFNIGTHKHAKLQEAILLESIPYILGQIEDIDRLTVEIPSAGYSEISRTIVVTKKAVEEGKLPVIRFQLTNGIELAFSPEDYVLDYTCFDYCATVFAYKVDFIGTPRLPGNLTGVNWVFGRPIMAKYCTSYDFGKKQIGFSLGKDTK